MPGWLSVALDDAAVASLLVVAPNGTETRFRDIRGSARITHSRIEFKDGHVRSTGWAVAGASGTLFAREPLAFDVTTAWSLTDDNLVAGIARATGDLKRLLVDAQVAAPAKGRVQAELRDLASKLTFRGKAEIESLDLKQWVDEPPVGPLAASLDIEGDRLRYAARGRLRGPGLPATGIGVDMRASYVSPVVSFESIALEAAPGLDVRAAGTLQTGEAPSFDVSATWNAFRWPLAGNPFIVSPRGSLRGAWLDRVQLSRERRLRAGAGSADRRRSLGTLHECGAARRRFVLARAGRERDACRIAGARRRSGMVGLRACRRHRSFEAAPEPARPAGLRVHGFRPWIRAGQPVDCQDPQLERRVPGPTDPRPRRSQA